MIEVSVVVLLILWYAVAILSVKCLNAENGDEEEWKSLNKFTRVLILTIAPPGLIILSIEEAFKK